MSFAVTADAYDRFMGRYSTRLAVPFVDLADLAPGQTALDVGCGPGAVTAELVRRLGPASVAAVDPSEGFVAAARARHPGVDVRQAPAEALPHPDGTFDAALAQLVVHFMADPVAGLAEMARVTRPGGVVAACVWDFAGDRAPISVFWRAARDVLPDVEGEAGLPGARPGDLARILGTAGLRDVEETELAIRAEHPTFDDWWEPFSLGVGPSGAFAQRLGPEELEAVRRRSRELLRDEPIALTAVAWAARGRP